MHHSMMKRPWLSPNSTSEGVRSGNRRRLSDFFRGSSILESEQDRGRRIRSRKESRLALERHPLNGNLRVCYQKARVSVLRSPSSTRSVIDPSASPGHGTSPLSGITFEYPQQTCSRMVLGRMAGSPNPRGLVTHSRPQSAPNSTTGPIWPSRRKSSRTRTLRARTKAIRKRVLLCSVFGSMLALILTVYLALALSDSISSQEVHIVLILITLAITVAFSHSLIRLCMVARRRRARKHTLEVSESAAVDFQGYADLIQPIQVALADDEELGYAGEEVDSEEGLALPPPVYGLWRGSVRADPALLYWQRSDTSQYSDNGMADGINRPPSYISDEGSAFEEAGHYPTTPSNVQVRAFDGRYYT